MAVPTSKPLAPTAGSIGFADAWRRFFSDFLTEREVIRTLFRRNFIHRFAGSGLGFAWLVVMPCLPVFIYNLLQVMGIFSTPEGEIPRSVFLTFGLILYYTFSETLTAVATDTVTNRRYIVDSGIPKMAIILSTIVQVTANFAIRSAVFLLLMVISFGAPQWTIVLAPLFAVPLIILGLAIGLLCNLFCVLYYDLTNIVRVASFYLLFASGVFTVIPADGLFFNLLRLSPIYQLISTGRMVALQSDFSFWPQILLVTLFCLFVFPFALVAFYRAEKLVNSYL